MRQYETYRCDKCGAEVEVQNVGGGTLSCCGEPMKCITEDLTQVNLMKAFAGESQARNKAINTIFTAIWPKRRAFMPLRDIFTRPPKTKNGTPELS